MHIAAGIDDLAFAVTTLGLSMGWFSSRRRRAAAAEVPARNLAEAALRESRESYRHLVEDINDVIYAVDARGTVTYMSPVAERVFGTAPAEVIDRHFSEFIFPADLPLVAEWFRDALAGRPEPHDHRIVTKSGDVRWVRNYSRVIVEGDQIAGLRGVLSDVTERKRLEDEIITLNQSLERRVAARTEELTGVVDQLRLQGAALESAADSIMVTDREGRITWVNPAFTRITGYTAAEALGQSSRLLKSGTHDAAFFQHMWQTLLSGRVYHNEIINRRKDGRLYSGEVVIAPVRDRQGEITHFVEIQQDVTDRKKAAEREAARLRQLRQLSDLSMRLSGDPAIVFEHVVRMIGELFEVPVVCLSEIVGRELVFRAVYADGRVSRDAGRCPLDITPCATVEESKDLRVLDRVAERFPQASFLRDHHAFAYCGFPALDGEGRVVAVTCLLDDKPHEFTEEDREILRLIGQRIALEVERGRSIAARERAEATLRGSEERFRLIAETITEVFWMTDVERARMFYISPAYEQVWGRACESLYESPSSFLDALHPADRQRVLADLEVEKTGQPFDHEYRIIRPDGSIRWIWDRGFPVRERTGHVTRYVGVAQDITERKQAGEHIRRLNAELEQRVRERTAELEAANTELEAFSYSVSHDLRAPLRHIAGYAEMLQEDCGDRLCENGQRHLGAITASVVRMGTMIDALLAFSRIGQVPVRRGAVDLNALTREVLVELEQDTRNRNIRWSIGALPRVSADPSLLRQVLANLIGNAIKYSRPRDPARIEIGCPGETADEVVICVRDNGVGFDMQYAAKLFGVFQRLHGADEFEGTGVGLANVRRIIHRHGGRIWAEAAEGEGAAFFFALPTR